MEDLSESHLRQLVDNEVREGTDLDYKRDKIGSLDLDKKEFLRDICSLVTAGGGHLIIGIEEGEGNDSGIAKNICGFTVDNIDQETTRLNQIIISGIVPRINRISIKPIKLSDSNTYVIVIRIPASFTGPHGVAFKNSPPTFYSRTSSGKYHLDVPEIGTLFSGSTTALERVRIFRIERVSKILANQMPMPIPQIPKLVLHMVPFYATNKHTNIDLHQVSSHPEWLNPLSAEVEFGKFNFDGFVTYSKYNNRGNVEECPAYTQIFRDGAIEAVWTYPFQGYKEDKRIPSLAFENELIDGIGYYLRKQERLDVVIPIYIMVTLLGVEGYRMVMDNYGNNSEPFDKDSLLVPEVMIDRYEIDISKSMKDMLDIIWNSVGVGSSVYYDDSGNRIDSRKQTFYF